MIGLTRTQLMDMNIKQCSTMHGIILDQQKTSMILYCFVGRLATAFAITTLIEADYSILKREKRKNQALTDLSMEGVFQTNKN
jgi:hypothetical protein